eukprot:UN29167
MGCKRSSIKTEKFSVDKNKKLERLSNIFKHRTIKLVGPIEANLQRYFDPENSTVIPVMDFPDQLKARMLVRYRLRGLGKYIQALDADEIIADIILSYEPFLDTKPKRGDVPKLSQYFVDGLRSSTCKNLDYFFTAVPKRAAWTQNSYSAGYSGYAGYERRRKAATTTTRTVIRASTMFQRIRPAWKEDPYVCLKTLFHVGAVREGKTDVFVFYHGLLWLFKYHPATLIANLDHVPNICYWKALLELLVRVVEGEELSYKRDCMVQRLRSGEKDQVFHIGSPYEFAVRFLSRYDRDPLFRALYEKTCYIFAKQLKRDMTALEKDEKVSLCAKWVPNLDSSYDRRGLVCEGVARYFFPKDESEEYKKMDLFQYRYVTRDRLRKTLVRLRKKLHIVECHMSAGTWEKIQYDKVPSMCLTLHSVNFAKYDADRWNQYMKTVEKSKKPKIHELNPTEILTKARGYSDKDQQVAEKMWKQLMETIGENKLFGMKCRNTICIVDPSMEYLYEGNEVAIALAMLFGELNKGKYKNTCLRFSNELTIYPISGPKLKDKHDMIKGYKKGGIAPTVKIILETCLKRHIEESYEVPSRVFVFTCQSFSIKDTSKP